MNTLLAPDRAFRPFRHQTGLSLVELMVAITIGLFLLLALTTLIVQQNSTRDELEKSSRQVENGRYAMQLLHDDIQLAGFYSEYTPASGVVYSTPDPCSTGDQGWAAASATVPVPVLGYTGADPTPGCVADRQAGTAILVVRRTATESISAASAVAGTNYLQVSRCEEDDSPLVMMAANVSDFTLRTKTCNAAADIRKYIVRIYYIRSAPPDNIPTLTMMEFMDNVQNTIPLVEGIENLQFEYGLDNVAPADGAPDTYVTAPATADWSNVVTVRVHLLARNIDTTAGHLDTKTYNLGPAASAVAPGGAYKRHAYRGVIRVVNVSGRREEP